LNITVYISICNLVSYPASDSAVGNLKAVKSVISAYRDSTGQNTFSTFNPH